MGRRLICLMCILVVLGLSAPAPAQHVVAEELLVDLRAEDLASGDATWPNRGTLADFTAQGEPVVESLGGLAAVTFDGTCWFDGPTSTPGIEGAGTRTIEVWAYNPSAVGEETIVHWSHRGGPEGTNIAFNYGNHGTWGAVGHWGSPDMPWGGSVSPTPQLGKWWHLVYTYDGTTVRLYANGNPAGQRAVALNTHAGNIIRVAAQGDDSGQGVLAAVNFTGSIAEVRIHDGVLTQQQIQQNYKLGGPRKASGPSPADGEVGVANPLFQWEIGTTAQWHNVYLGTSPELGPADLVAPRLMFNMHWHVPGLAPGTTYYWRVDEIEVDGATTYEGDVWSFTSLALTAFAPTPPDGARFQASDVDLAWLPGKDASTYDVYFGTSRQDVLDGTGETFQGTQALMSYELPPLAPGVTYFWRIDLIDTGGSTQAGDVWSFTTIRDIAVSDPNLVGWWKLDEGEGTVAIDSSGLGNHGQILGGTTWIEGYDGGALELDGQNGYVDLPIGTLIPSLNSVTITSWVDFANAGGAWQRIFDFGSGATTYIFLCPRTGTAGPMRLALTTAAGAGESLIDTGQTLPTGWHHMAAVVNGTSRTMQVYLDGMVIASGGTQTLPADLGETSQNWLGRSQYSADGYLRAALDDFRIYDYPMTAEQIPETMRGDPALAWNPQPANDSEADIRDAQSLSWTAGDAAAQHDVYFGADRDAVANADTNAPQYMGRQPGTAYSLAGLVEFGGGTYFWRIDEVEADGATLHTGRLWAFTVPDYLIVDDFESYTDEVTGRIFQSWIDGWGYTEPPPGDPGNGTGATVGYLDPPFAEQTIVHGGSQSMPLDYNNIIPPYYSETERTWASPQDWTLNDVDTLSLWVRGYQASSVVNETAPGAFSVTGEGADIWDSADQFTFVYKTLNGDGEIVARVVSNGEGSNTWAKGGVMIRDTLAAGSTHAMQIITGSAGNGASFQWRPVADDVSSSSDVIAAVAPPYWVKIERVGNNLSGYLSDNGTTWTQQGLPQIIFMTPPFHIGLCVTSHAAGENRTFEFDNVTTAGSVSGQWRSADIGLTRNDPATLYAAIQDSAGTVAVVPHPDPGMVNVTDWTEWPIPLSEFGNVDLARVKKMLIGVGNRNAPTPDGAGMLYIDDIRVIKPAPQ